MSTPESIDESLGRPIKKGTLSVSHNWYQTDRMVCIGVLVKSIKAEYFKVKIEDDKVTVSISHPSYEFFELTINLLHKIQSDKSDYRLSAAKIEVNLLKVDGITWKTLEAPPKEENIEAIQTVPGPQFDKPPSYPTSKKGKDWSLIEKEIIQQEAQEKPEGEEAVNKLFQEIYGKGSDEVKMAMNKSYMESGGTVLSTNWNEISKQKVDVKPPDGMEFKKWND
ncbi:unnamed protein product [Phaedon cochleariae]|uniref:Uncharacterized protein n=1 Tax=Phaedon cochleariae TaxID=80249 RepID=A0A9P0D9W2_PHACE|nr:unnamed protein product [Phaedon cochleariae]